MKHWLAVCCVFAIGCVGSDSVTCGDGRLCPARTICDDVHQLCVGQDQLDGCQGQPDGTACQFANGTASGECNQSVCLTPICGDGLVELPEVCDDGNLKDEDASVQNRCSSNCASKEVCGNGIVDVVVGELCDDSNLLDHDGCSSACKPETLAWSQLADPAAQYNPVAALDPLRRRVVLYSEPANAPSSIVAEWDGTWHASIPAVSPGPPRRFPAMAAFEPHRSVVLQGGGVGDGPDNQTWEWDGVIWTRLADGPVLQEHAMAYDSHRKKLVLFGGDDGGKAVSDTWEFDGSLWKRATPASSPPARYDHSMAYDPVRGVVVMFGGRDVNGPLTDTWEYDGQTWTLKSSSMLVIQRSPLAYSSKANGVVMVCGFDSGNSGTNTMYVWSGSAWTSASTPITTRGWHALSETGDGGLLVFSGITSFSGGTLRTDTWLYDGTAWTPASAPLPRIGLEAVNTRHGVIATGGADASFAYPPGTWQLAEHRAWTLDTSGGPSGRLLSPLAYDETRDTVVQFGGLINGSTADDVTWQRGSNSVWFSTHPSPSPQPRGAHTLAYDIGHAQVVLFGGVVSGAPANDTWTFDGMSWTQRTPATVPPARAYASMTYDRVNHVVLLFGGIGEGSVLLNDLWSWNGSDWSEITPPGDRPAGSMYPRSLLWVPSLHSAMLVGGSSSPTMETWQLSSVAGSYTWIDVRTLTAPLSRVYTAVFVAPDQSGVTVYSGSDGSNPQYDAWLLSYVSDRVSDTCENATDLDGDSRTLCDDPDCWRVCSPLCPPETSCASSTPRCGDGKCDAGLETCSSCAADCTGCASVCGDSVCDSGETCPGDCP